MRPVAQIEASQQQHIELSKQLQGVQVTLHNPPGYCHDAMIVSDLRFGPQMLYVLFLVQNSQCPHLPMHPGTQQGAVTREKGLSKD
eukprot:1161655-Pelagomonas_calceolata.AAC.1